MKWTRIFLMLFFVPCFLFALSEDKCKEIQQKAIDEWKRSEDLIEKINNLQPDQTQIHLNLLKEAVACCQSTIAHLDTILNDIASKSKKDQRIDWRRKMKKSCTEDKEAYSLRLADLQKTLEEALIFDKAKALYEESLKKADEAKKYERPRHLNDNDIVTAAFNETAILYEEAASYANEALALIYSSSREKDKGKCSPHPEKFLALKNKLFIMNRHEAYL